jgi:hypothetical protein
MIFNRLAVDKTVPVTVSVELVANPITNVWLDGPDIAKVNDAAAEPALFVPVTV